MLSRNRCKKNPSVHRCLAKSVANRKELISFWTFFKFLGNQGELERTETTKNFLLMQWYLSKVKLQFS